MVNKIVKIASSIGDYLKIVKAFLKAYEVFVLELKGGNAELETDKETE